MTRAEQIEAAAREYLEAVDLADVNPGRDIPAHEFWTVWDTAGVALAKALALAPESAAPDILRERAVLLEAIGDAEFGLREASMVLDAAGLSDTAVKSRVKADALRAALTAARKVMG